MAYDPVRAGARPGLAGPAPLEVRAAGHRRTLRRGEAVTSMVLGLAVSATITNADRGMPLLVLLAMLQFTLSSALLQIGGSPVLAQLSWLVLRDRRAPAAGRADPRGPPALKGRLPAFPSRR